MEVVLMEVKHYQVGQVDEAVALNAAKLVLGD